MHDQQSFRHDHAISRDGSRRTVLALGTAGLATTLAGTFGATAKQSAIPTRLPRRTLAGLLGLSSLSVVSPSIARKNKKKKKVKRNDFNCVDAGKFCKNDGPCCSGICEDKKTECSVANPKGTACAGLAAAL